ncbi:hypothetical protein GUJ93_ZPchr0006g42009 [Zizania palustris]|uniref:Uncharacterized protein n=1 Tax=Zizania palustris TaxID=103762 RepID=A0A8J5VSK4_ZIZPA|nr:hypothetical protein GUJ93_ZPchr0006g42009 [Zizania palustris]
MGSKLSCIYRPDSAVDSKQLEDSAPAARVVAADGTLRELQAYPRVAVVSDVLGGGGDDAAGFFVCNSDALSFDEHPPALAHGEPLRPGELYFVLPAAMLRRPLLVADMAALAVRASAALAGAAGEKPVLKPRRQTGRQLLRRRHGGSKKKQVRVAPAAQALADDDDDDLEAVLNEKRNEQTLGVFAVFLSPARGGAMLTSTSTAAARSPVKRALSLIEEDA